MPKNVVWCLHDKPWWGSLQVLTQLFFFFLLTL